MDKMNNEYISNNIKICIKCNNIPINKIIQEWRECYECGQDDRPFNMNRKNKGICKCLKIDIDILFCTNCEIQVYLCKYCLNYYEKDKDSYIHSYGKDEFYYKNCIDSCIECFKNNNPSDDNNIYEYNDNNKSWKLINIKKECTICNENYYIKNKNGIDICLQCQLKKLQSQLKKLQKQFNNIEFNIINEDIMFRKKCICNFFTDYYRWSEHHTDNKHNNVIQCNKYNVIRCNNHNVIQCNNCNPFIDMITYDWKIIQCINCNPSTDMIIYKWTRHHPYWMIDKIYTICIKCKKKMLYTINNFTNDIIQCINCNPSNNYIKFKFIEPGWNIDKIKIFNGTKHTWNNTYIKDINYKCNCIKCI